jgi:NAD+ synthase (glutamine-hydrolysing)
VKLALTQRNVTIGDFEGILAIYHNVWKQAHSAGIDLLILPELTTTGYPPKDLLSRRSFVTENVQVLEEMASWTTEGPAIIGGYIEPNYEGDGNDFFNGAALLDGGLIQHRIRKSLLPSYDVFDEDRYFEHGTQREVVPFRGIPLGITICEDIWSSPEHWNKLRYPVDPCAELAEKGARLFINISASPFTLGKAAVRRNLIAETAKRHGLHTVYVNQIGAHDELIFDGHSIVANPNGHIITRLKAFEEDFAIVEIPDDELMGVSPPSLKTLDRQSPPSPEEEGYQALVVGTRDYVRKSGFQSVILGLSGGIDSALTAAVATDALGPENVRGVAMPTRFSSEHSLRDAQDLAENLGISFETISIDKAFQALLDQMAPVLDDLASDITEENIQARLRGITLMAMSNKTGSLVLTTGNKSEMAVGYCTLYGDMCGALAVIADVPKTLVFSMSRWLNRNGIRIPENTLTKPPSAELRPGQLDQDSLPPYDILDRIIEEYVEHDRSADDITEQTGISHELVSKIIKWINQTEYKRRQAAPVLKITSKAFGVGRRFPIVASHNSINKEGHSG